VGPAFYERDQEGVPRRWVGMVRHTLFTLRPQVQASRMVAEYVDDWYGPAARSATLVGVDDFAGARRLASYRSRLEAVWGRVRVIEVDASGASDTPVLGAPMTVRAGVELGGLCPDDVAVQVVVGRVDDADELSDTVTMRMTHVGPADGPDARGERFAAVVQLALIHIRRCRRSTLCTSRWSPVLQKNLRRHYVQQLRITLAHSPLHTLVGIH